MPCRPAENDFTRKDGVRAESDVAGFIEERKQLRRVLLDYATDPNLALPEELSKALQESVSEQIPPLPPRPEGAVPNRYPTPRHGSWALELLFRADREERTLCEGRTLLMKLSAVRAPSSEVRADCEKQIEAHREHRVEDLGAVRQALRDQLAYFERLDDRSAKELDELRERLRRAEGLLVDDILHDRSELDALWPPR